MKRQPIPHDSPSPPDFKDILYVLISIMGKRQFSKEQLDRVRALLGLNWGPAAIVRHMKEQGCVLSKRYVSKIKKNETFMATLPATQEQSMEESYHM